MKCLEESFKLILQKPTHMPPEQKCAFYILLLRLRPRYGGVFRKLCEIEINVQIYKVSSRMGFFLRQGGVLSTK